MLSSVVNRPNTVVERQRLMQASHDPIYYRLPRSRLYLGTYYTGFALGMLGVGYGAFTLIRGKQD